MSSMLRHAFLPVAAALVLSACGSLIPPHKGRFDLSAERPSDMATGSGEGTLQIMRVQVAPLFERKSFVYEVGGYEQDFYNEFFATPASLIREATRDWLRDSGLFSSVLDASQSGGVDWRLSTDVTRLYADLRHGEAPASLIEISFALLDARSPRQDVVFSKRYASRVAIEDTSPASIAQGWNEALADVLTELEQDLGRDHGGAAVGGPFGLQLAAMSSAAAAEREWARLQQRHPELLGNQGHARQRVDLGPRGIFHRVIAGPFTSRAAADNLCLGLQAVGQYCLIVTFAPPG